MVSNSYTNISSSTINSKGFGKKTSNIVTLRIRGRKIYVQQILKNSLSREKLVRFCSRFLTRKLWRTLGIASFSSLIIFVCPRKASARDLGEPLVGSVIYYYLFLCMVI